MVKAAWLISTSACRNQFPELLQVEFSFFNEVAILVDYNFQPSRLRPKPTTRKPTLERTKRTADLTTVTR